MKGRWTSPRRWIVIAVLLAVVALGALAWLLLGRAEPPSPATAETQRRLDRLDRLAAVVEAEIAVATVWAELSDQADAGDDGLAGRVDAMGDRLQAALAGAPSADGPSWDDLSEAFDALESELRDADPAAQSTASALADVLGRYRR